MEEEIGGVIRWPKNWKAPGTDQVHNYWFKHLRGLQPTLYNVTNHRILYPDLISKWLTGGQTILLFEKGSENVSCHQSKKALNSVPDGAKTTCSSIN
eukprot:8395450-Ditylum_brightwellii.AAC.1